LGSSTRPAIRRLFATLELDLQGEIMDNTRREILTGGAALALTLSAMKAGAETAKPAGTFRSPRDGLWVAAVTPVDRKMNFDAAAYKDMLALWKSQGADGALVLGTTGEGQSFSLAERKKVIEFVGKNKAGMDIIVGTGTANFPDTIELSRHAADHGADSVLIVPPFYEKNPSGDGVLRYFDQIFSAVKTPVRYYHIPRTTGVPVTDPSVWSRLGQYPNLVGIKDSNGDAAEYDVIRSQVPKLAVFTGTDPLVPQALGSGNGAILASCNVFTRQWAAVWAAHRAGQDINPALTKVKAAQALLKQPGYGQGMTATKYALGLMLGNRELLSRPPELDKLTDAEMANIRKGVAEIKALG
jgi:4-hydroxy-tetrahydrodipicolinate synthase